jgi:hypothetical protein
MAHEIQNSWIWDTVVSAKGGNLGLRQPHRLPEIGTVHALLAAAGLTVCLGILALALWTYCSR